jgi:hypothetical protein
MNSDDVRIPYGAHTLKYPAHPQAETSQYGKGRQPSSERADWTPNPLGAKAKDAIELPTTSNGMDEKTPHATQKPEELIRKFVLASSNAGISSSIHSPARAPPRSLRSNLVAAGSPATTARNTTNGLSADWSAWCASQSKRGSSSTAARHSAGKASDDHPGGAPRRSEQQGSLRLD